MGTVGNGLHVIFPVYSDCFMYIIISQLNDLFISVNQARYETPVIAKYLDTAKIKDSSEPHKTTLIYAMIFTEEDDSISN